MSTVLRLLPLPFIVLGLLSGVLGGLGRLGVLDAPAWATAHHGLLMTGGFLGSLIVLERTVTQTGLWWRIFPAASAMGTLLLATGQQRFAISVLMVGNAGLLAVYMSELRKHAAWPWYAMLAGSLCWAMGNVVLLRTELVAAATPWWMGFILLTIVGERLDLTRYLPVPERAKALLMVFLGVAVVGIAMPFHNYGGMVLGAAMVAATAWLLRYDMARTAVRKAGIHRYVATGLLVGYGWLMLCGAVLLLGLGGAMAYDLTLHTFFLGFAFSMIWAHAPIILPGVLKVAHQPFHPVLWGGWALFQLSLMGRIAATLLHESQLRAIMATANGITIVAMFGLMAGIMVLRVRATARR